MIDLGKDLPCTQCIYGSKLGFLGVCKQEKYMQVSCCNKVERVNGVMCCPDFEQKLSIPQRIKQWLSR